MPNSIDDRTEKARDLAEKALGEYAKGDKQKGDKLAEQAVTTDRDAVEEVVCDLEEDAKRTGEPDDDAGRP
jgi:DNA-binding ferritin-like protein